MINKTLALLRKITKPLTREESRAALRAEFVVTREDIGLDSPEIAASLALTPLDGYELALRLFPMPSDSNFNGDIFGGWIMAQVDLAGSVVAYRIARGRIATVAVNEFVFKQPVSVGDLLSFYGKIERVGTTSITVRVEVHAERNPANPQTVKVTEARLTYVAIDAEGRPRPVPKPI